MKKIVLFVIMALAFGACKKSNNSPSIVGIWKISNISGTYVSRSSPYAASTTTTFSYSAPILSELISDSNFENIVKLTVSDEEWQFNTDGTVAIYENFVADTGTTQIVNNINGWWDYTGSTTPNSSVVLRTYTTPVLLPTGGTFLITQVTGDQLILNVNESSSLSTGPTTDRNITMTFMKQ